MTIRAVVFDLDYTLAVSDRTRQSILDTATDAVGAPDLSRQAYLDAHGRHLDSETRVPIFADLLADFDTDVAPEALSEAYQAAILDAMTAVDDAEALIAELGERYELGLLTNGPVDAQEGKIETLGWGDRFDAIVVTGSLDAGKPDERAFRAVLDALGVAPEESVYVGDDIEADIHGAKNVGMAAVQVLFPDGPESDPEADAHVERANLREDLPPIIDSLG